MKRDYSTKQIDEVKFFVGVEVERTPAFGLKTLFVVGIQEFDEIYKYAKDEEVSHIFFGANHSFNPTINEMADWEYMIAGLLDENFLCSLDIPISAVDIFHDTGLNEYHNFIPQIRVPIPNIKLWNYNTMIKIDDTGFDYSNPGIWTHNLIEFMDHAKFTSWRQYKNDRIIK